jgi:hypothetical protein
MSEYFLHKLVLELNIAIYKLLEAGLTPPADLSLFSEEAQPKEKFNIKPNKEASCSAEKN